MAGSQSSASYNFPKNLFALFKSFLASYMASEIRGRSRIAQQSRQSFPGYFLSQFKLVASARADLREPRHAHEKNTLSAFLIVFSFRFHTSDLLSVQARRKRGSVSDGR
jgi:hypothetical protein